MEKLVGVPRKLEHSTGFYYQEQYLLSIK